MKSQVKKLEHGVSNSWLRIPYVLAHLSCYHVIGGEDLKVGDEVECNHCDQEQKTMQMLRERRKEILLARYRPNFGGNYSFYRYDSKSPSGKMLFASLDANPNVEKFLNEIKCSPLSPTECLGR